MFNKQINGKTRKDNKLLTDIVKFKPEMLLHSLLSTLKKGKYLSLCAIIKIKPEKQNTYANTVKTRIATKMIHNITRY